MHVMLQMHRSQQSAQIFLELGHIHTCTFMTIRGGAIQWQPNSLLSASGCTRERERQRERERERKRERVMEWNRMGEFVWMDLFESHYNPLCTSEDILRDNIRQEETDEEKKKR